MGPGTVYDLLDVADEPGSRDRESLAKTNGAHAINRLGLEESNIGHRVIQA